MVFFVIVTYNSNEYILNCISSIKKFEPGSKIIAVDNNSSDNTLDLLGRFEDIIIFKNKENLGFGKGNNIGVKHALDAGAEYVYLLNHDAYLVEPLIQKIIPKFFNNPSLAIISPLHVQGNQMSLEMNFSKFLFEDGALTKMVSDSFLRNNTEEWYDASFVPAASWMIKADVIKKIGMFNPLFFHYGEDNEFLNRLKYHEMKVAVLTNCRVVHLSNQVKFDYKKNYGWYHRNRIFSSWLVNQLDINKPDSTSVVMVSVLSIVKGMIGSILKLKLVQAWGQFILLMRMLSIIHKIFPSRRACKEGVFSWER
jgi:GT2 family glycosyltransferase